MRIAELAVLVAMAAPCGGPQSVTDAYATWQAAYHGHDLAGTMAFFDPSIVMSFAGSPDANYDALQRSYKDEFSQKQDAQWIPTFETPTVDGNLAVAVSRWRLIRNGVDLIHNRGVDVLRCESGAWRVVRSFNYTEWQKKPNAST